ncbi:MAG: hypothetical protein IPL46_24605 [Saprospiraceae bacterium]|nr:hypothetical protein [Saprospiraceae bacterium]
MVFFRVLNGLGFEFIIPEDPTSAPEDIRIANPIKLKGVHYFGRFHEGELDFSKITDNHVKQIVLVPYGYQENFDSPSLTFNRQGRRASIDRDSLYGLMAEKASKASLEIVIKPHIWMETKRGKWRSDIDFQEEQQFDEWAKNYSEFILHYARLSQKIGATHFCVGTELTQMTKNHPNFWKGLIKEVRQIYHGKIFYAANWYREYEHITFWSDLDYIGVQGYFPLCNKDHPNIDDLMVGWRVYRSKLMKMSQRLNKPVLFSELGYRSSQDAASEPWEWVEGPNALKMKLSQETQAICYEAFFRTFWNEPWFGGALIWQWHTRYENDLESTKTNLDFTPQNKPAQAVMSKWFAE